MGQDIPTFADAVMPRSTIRNCAREVVKADTVIQKDALTALAKGSTVFISYLTTHANEIAFSKKRKTIMPADVFEALKIIEFERFIPDLKANHDAQEAEAKDKRTKKAELASAIVPTEDDDEEHDEDLPHPKKPRVEVGTDGQVSDDLAADEVMQVTDEEDLEEEADDEEELDEEEEEDEEDDEDEERDEGDEVGAQDGAGVADSSIIEQDLPEEQQQDTYDEALDNGEDSD